MEKTQIVFSVILVFVTITCWLPLLDAFVPDLTFNLHIFSITLPTWHAVGMIMLLVGIPLGLALSDRTLLTATIFGSYQAWTTFAYPLVWFALLQRLLDGSIMFVLSSASWWFYFLFIGAHYE